MNFTQIIGIGLTTAVLTILIKEHRPELAFVLPLLATVCIFISVAPQLKLIVAMLENIAEQAAIEGWYIRIILKIIGIAYVCQFSAELCKDAGITSIASKIELGGKIIIMAISAPMIYKLLDIVKMIINY